MKDDALQRAALGCAVLSIGIGAMQSIWTHDTYGHIAQGRAIAASGGPSPPDPFSFFRPTPQPWINYEWGSDLLTWWLYRGGGATALVVTAMLVAALGVAGLVALAARRGGTGAAVVTALFAIVSMPALRFRLTARPHLVAYPFAAAYLAALTSERAFADGRRALRSGAALVALHVVWANLHGSHLLGIALTGIAAITALPDRARATRLALLVPCLVAASCVSPWGPDMLVDSLAHTLDPRFREAMPEWGPLTALWPTWNAFYPFLVLPLLLTLAPAGLRAGGARRTVMAVALFASVAALRSMRFVPEMLLLAAPAFGLELAARGSAPSPARAPAALVAALNLSLAAMPFLGARLPIGVGADDSLLPADAAAHLDHTLPGARVLARNETAWYLMFAAPRVRVLVDGRLPFFGPELLMRVNGALEFPGALAPIVQEFGVDTVLLDHTQRGQMAALATLTTDPSWTRTWVDAHHAVYTRLRRGSPLDALPPTYDPAPILSAEGSRLPAIRAGLDALSTAPDAQVFGAFVQSMLQLRRLAREGGRGGFRTPYDAADREALHVARDRLDDALERVQVPTLRVYGALMAILACDLDEGEARLREARADGENRETLFATEELHLRRGELRLVDMFLRMASREPNAEGDPWVASIQRGLTEPNPCVPGR